MNELKSSLTNPAWWVLTVVVGVLLNIAAEYLRRWAEGKWGAIRKERAAIKASNDERFKELVEVIRSSRDKEWAIIAAHESLDRKSLETFLCGLALLAISAAYEFSWVTVVLSLGGVLSMHMSSRFKKRSELLRDALSQSDSLYLRFIEWKQS